MLTKEELQMLKELFNEDKEVVVSEYKEKPPTVEPLPAKDICFCNSNKNKNNHYNAHYAAMAGLEPIEVMQLVLSREEFIGFLKGNIIKYSMRAGLKRGEPTEKDLAKAQRYKEWLMKTLYLDPKHLINPKED